MNIKPSFIFMSIKKNPIWYSADVVVVVPDVFSLSIFSLFSFRLHVLSYIYDRSIPYPLNVFHQKSIHKFMECHQKNECFRWTNTKSNTSRSPVHGCEMWLMFWIYLLWSTQWEICLALCITELNILCVGFLYF